MTVQLGGEFPMSIDIAARRGARDQRRKAVVAQKRKAEIEASSASGQVRLAVAHPIQHCLLSEGLFETGMGILVLARGATPAERPHRSRWRLARRAHPPPISRQTWRGRFPGQLR